MKTKTNTKAGGLSTVNHNEKIARSENVTKQNAEHKESKRNDGYGIKVMSIRTGIKAGWISRNYK
jgi:hypothetical protein